VFGRFKREWPSPLDVAQRDQEKDFKSPDEAHSNALDTLRARREQRELASHNIASRIIYKMVEQGRHLLRR
jgi:hypothetical protein